MDLSKWFKEEGKGVNEDAENIMEIATTLLNRKRQQTARIRAYCQCYTEDAPRQGEGFPSFSSPPANYEEA